MRYRQNPHAPFTTLGPEATIITPRDSRLHLLNAVASRIWELCDGDGATLDTIASQLVAEYDVSRDQATVEARAFLDDGVERGFLIAEE
jgi:hypothetical protein